MNKEIKPNPCQNEECKKYNVRYKNHCGLVINPDYKESFTDYCRYYRPEQQETCNCDRSIGGIDADIKPIVNALNNAGIKTIASCCGHTFQPSRISVVHNGVEKEILFCTYDQAQVIGKLFPDINGKRQQPEEHLQEKICKSCKHNNRKQEHNPCIFCRHSGFIGAHADNYQPEQQTEEPRQDWRPYKISEDLYNEQPHTEMLIIMNVIEKGITLALDQIKINRELFNDCLVLINKIHERENRAIDRYIKLEKRIKALEDK